VIAARLGLRFLLGAGRRGLVRLGLMVLGTMLAVWCLLVALAFPSILHARQDRAAGRTPVSAVDPGARRGWWDEVTRPVRGQMLDELFLVAEGEQTPTPPGLERVPHLGEAFVSPGFDRALSVDPGARAIFPYTVVGLISPDGLVSPDELFAVVGTSRYDLPSGGHALAGFGIRGRPEVDLASGDLRLLQLAFACLVGIPLAVFFTVVARLSAASRDRRLAALRLIGMSQRQTRRVSSIESLIVAVVGSAFGLGIYALTQARLASAGIGRLKWFPSDAGPTASVVLVCALGVPILSATVSTLASRPAVRYALAFRRQNPPKRPSPWRLLPLGVGLAVLVGLLIASSSLPAGTGLKSPGPLIMTAAIISTGVGLGLSFQVLGIWVAQILATRTRRIWAMLGTRRLMFEPSSSTRVVSGLVIVVFGMGFATGLQRDARAAAAPLGRYEFYQLDAQAVPSVAREQLFAVKDVRASLVSVASVVTAPSSGGEGAQPVEPGATVGFATCADISVFLEHVIQGCADGVPYRLAPIEGGVEIPKSGTTFHFPIDNSDAPRTFTLAVPDRTLPIHLLDFIALGSSLLFPPDQLPDKTIPESASIDLASDSNPAAVSSVIEGITGLAPLAQVRLLNDDLVTRHHSEVFQSLLNVALTLGFIIGILAFIVAALDRAVERRSNLVSLAIVGVPRGTLRAAQTVQILLPLSVGTFVAITTGKLVEQVTVGVGGYVRNWTWGGPLLALAAGSAAAALAVGATTAAVSKRIDVSLIRRE
jgi:hypothetical protein